MDVIERRYDFEGGSLTLRLDSERALDERDFEALEQIAADCQEYAERHSPGRRAAATDRAVDELGGEHGLTAG
jgi:hypothetical protein